MSTNLEYREKEKVGDRSAKLNEKKKTDRELEREIKNKGDIFLLEEQHGKFVAAVRKWEMLAFTKVKTVSNDTSSIKRVTREVSGSFTL